MSAVAEPIAAARPRARRLADPLRAARLTGATAAAGIFTFVFPLMFLVIFGALDKGQHTVVQRGGIPYDDFFVPGILAYGVIATTFVNMAISTAILRDEGMLKRMQGTPLPRWAYVAARIGSTLRDRRRR